MGKEKISIKKNYLYNLAYTLLNTALPLLTAPYLARTVGAEGIGVYAFHYSVAHFFFLFAKMGLSNYGTREIAKVRDTDRLSVVFSEIYTQQIIIALIVTVLYGIYGVFLVHNTPEKCITLILWIIVVGGVIDIDWVFSGLEAFKQISVRNTLVKSITVILIFVFVKSRDDLWIYTLLMSAGFLVGHISMWYNIKKYVHYIKVPLRNALRHFKPNFLLIIPVLAMSVYRYMDKIMLGSFSSMENTGLYDSAEKIIYALCGFINSFGIVMMPRMSSIVAKGDRKNNRKYMTLSMQFMMMLMCGMAFGLLCISNELVIILFGKDFSASGPLMAALAFTLPAMGWGNVIRTQYVIPNGQDKKYIYTVLFGAVVNLVVNWICIPRYGAMGAVIGTLCAEFGVVIMQYLLLRKEIEYKEILKKTIFAPVCGLLMYLAIIPFFNLSMNPVYIMMLQIVVGVIIFFGFTLIYLCIFEKELLAEIKRSVRL